jgi:hypothetical protein
MQISLRDVYQPKVQIIYSKKLHALQYPKTLQVGHNDSQLLCEGFLRGSDHQRTANCALNFLLADIISSVIR